MSRNQEGRVQFLAALMLFAITVMPAGSAWAVSLNDGQWETTTEMKIEGMPFAIPPVKVTQCITKDDPVPRQKDGEKNCKVKSQKITGNKVTWSQECVDKGTRIESQGEITYAGDSYKGTMKMKTTEKSGETSTATAVLVGRRIGACSDRSKKSVSVGGQEMPQVDPAMIEHAKKTQADLEKRQTADKKRSAEFAKLTVPAEAPGACAAKDFNLADCAGKVKLNLEPGEWEIRTEQGMRMLAGKTKTAGDYLFSGQNDADIQCVTLGSPVPSAARFEGPGEIKVAPKRITWKAHQGVSGVTMDDRGGINYSGSTLEGMFVRTQTTSGGTSETKTRITGKRIGEGDCLKQEMDFTSQKRDKAEKKAPAPGVDDAVNKLKGLFGR